MKKGGDIKGKAKKGKKKGFSLGGETKEWGGEMFVLLGESQKREEEGLGETKKRGGR